MNASIPDPNWISSLYDPLDAIRDELGNPRGSSAGWPDKIDYDTPLEQADPANSKWRRTELALTYGFTRPSYWGQLGDRGTSHSESAHIKLGGDNMHKGLIRKVTRALLPGEPCSEADGGNQHDWKCGPAGNGIDPWQIGWPTQGSWTNGKCAKWGGNDPALFARSDGSPNKMCAFSCAAPSIPTRPALHRH